MQLPLPLDDASRLESTVPPARTSITFVRRRRARRYVLRVDAEGAVRVTIPRGGSKREAVDFVERHHGWIEGQRRRLPTPSMSAAERAVLQKRAESELPVRLRRLAAQHALHVAQISIRNHRTRWGSCGRNGHITLNWHLVLMPDWVADYVLVHELMHLRRLDHSAAYWNLVAAAYPRYREARQWLRLNAEQLR